MTKAHGCEYVIGFFIWGKAKCMEPATEEVNFYPGHVIHLCAEHKLEAGFKE